ncbi:MAG: hypothetical protein COA78_36470 [Blastopirellula sp.]|nr:MAG: hypothetical protein COA78_36470 [Blastopirellula sp.]
MSAQELGLLEQVAKYDPQYDVQKITMGTTPNHHEPSSYELSLAARSLVTIKGYIEKFHRGINEYQMSPIRRDSCNILLAELMHSSLVLERFFEGETELELMDGFIYCFFLHARTETMVQYAKEFIRG